MNKATKGALAAAAAAAILAGGAGTMAAWNASSSLGSGSVTAGQMNIEQVGTGSWHWNTPGGAVFNPGSDKLVPGDTVVYVGDYKITAVGTNLKATLTPTLGGVSGTLLPYLTVGNVGGTAATITAGDNNTTKQVGTTITFNAGTTGSDGATTTASLAGSTITLQQTIS